MDVDADRQGWCLALLLSLSSLVVVRGGVSGLSAVHYYSDAVHGLYYGPMTLIYMSISVASRPKNYKPLRVLRGGSPSGVPSPSLDWWWVLLRWSLRGKNDEMGCV